MIPAGRPFFLTLFSALSGLWTETSGISCHSCKYANGETEQCITTKNTASWGELGFTGRCLIVVGDNQNYPYEQVCIRYMRIYTYTNFDVNTGKYRPMTLWRLNMQLFLFKTLLFGPNIVPLWAEKFMIFDPNILLRKGTIFCPNNIPISFTIF